MKAGLNLYSVRKLIETEKDFIETAKKLKAMGYDYMQFSGAPYDHEMIKRVVDESGMPVVLTHVAFDRIVNDTEKLVEEHLSFGCKNIGLGTMPMENRSNDDEWKKRIDELNVAAEKIKSLGAKFFYHNHHFEFFRFKNGQTAFDYMIDDAPNFNFILDSYWVQVGGKNPETFVDRVKGRIDCVHFKDYRMDRKINEDGTTEFSSHFAPVGSGNLDFKAIAKKWVEAGAKYILVEQDDAWSYDDPLAQVKQSIDYIKTL